MTQRASPFINTCFKADQRATASVRWLSSLQIETRFFAGCASVLKPRRYKGKMSVNACTTRIISNGVPQFVMVYRVKCLAVVYKAGVKLVLVSSLRSPSWGGFRAITAPFSSPWLETILKFLLIWINSQNCTNSRAPARTRWTSVAIPIVKPAYASQYDSDLLAYPVNLLYRPYGRCHDADLRDILV